MKTEYYDVIIIGGGAAGLFCAANLIIPEGKKGIILESREECGKKLILTGKGRCNLTRTGDIKDFVHKYGENGKKIRKPLFAFNNDRVMDFFKNADMELKIEEDGRVFPKSERAVHVRNMLMEKSIKNGFDLLLKEKAETIRLCLNQKNCKKNKYIVNKRYITSALVIATGGASFPHTGSTGELLSEIEGLGHRIVKLKPALSPLFVRSYPYSSLSGISLTDCQIKKLGVGSRTKEKIMFRGDLLFTHRGFSGPLALNFSRFANIGESFILDFCPNISDDEFRVMRGEEMKLAAYLYKKTNLPKAFTDKCIFITGSEKNMRLQEIGKKEWQRIKREFKEKRFYIDELGNMDTAMVTAGGVDLEDIDLNTMESRILKGMFFIGEVVDVDGDTGGYNLQWAFSSAHSCATFIGKMLQNGHYW